jgi:dihydropteroate synthase
MQRRCQVWAVLNVTPDSFSDGGQYLDPQAALARAKELLAGGADVLDIGGASSRPPGKTYGAGAAPVSVEEELRRVIPVVEQVVGELGARVSVDTVRPEVARQALRAGARIINDISTGTVEELLEVTAAAGAEIAIMHNRGDGSASGENILYRSVIDDVLAELSAAAVRASCAGISFGRIWLDPGIGFAKTAADSLAVMAGLPKLVATGYRVLVGPSRKSFIGVVEANADVPQSTPLERLGGTAAAISWSVMAGAQGVRVHDLPVMRQTVLVTEALIAARESRTKERPV